jgi:hypothetical protein
MKESLERERRETLSFVDVSSGWMCQQCCTVTEYSVVSNVDR